MRKMGESLKRKAAAKPRAHTLIIGLAGYLVTAAAMLGRSALAGAPPFA